MIEIKVEDGEVRGLLNTLSGRLRNMSPAMRAISGIMHHAVEENFEQGGRPNWNNAGWRAGLVPSYRSRLFNGRAVGSAEIFLLSPCITPENSISQKGGISTND